MMLPTRFALVASVFMVSDAFLFASPNNILAAQTSHRGVHRLFSSPAAAPLRRSTPRMSSGEEGAQEEVGYLSLQHAGVLVEDVERSLKFYTQVLGMKDESHMRNPNLPYPGPCSLLSLRLVISTSSPLFLLFNRLLLPALLPPRRCFFSLLCSHVARPPPLSQVCYGDESSRSVRWLRR